MGRNRRQQRLRERRSRDNDQPAPAEQPRRASGGALSSRSKPQWRQTVDSWGGFTVIGAIAAAVILGALLIFVNRPGSSADGTAYVPHERDAAQAGVVLGDPSAPVRLIQYIDFQCPFCRRFWEEIEPILLEEYISTGQASMEFRNYAFLGSESQRAAEAAACAADHNRFWDFHDLLLLRQGRQNSGVFSDSNLGRYARTIGDEFSDFDVNAWEDCFDAGTYTLQVQEENRVATSNGIASTPTLLVNGQPVPGVQSIETYRTAIDAALNR
ncbi:MAG: DsbA family protein [Chloroflexi bacterium]|nr:DsbA family protein [Chloroflexota bacterium]